MREIRELSEIQRAILAPHLKEMAEIRGKAMAKQNEIRQLLAMAFPEMASADSGWAFDESKGVLFREIEG